IGHENMIDCRPADLLPDEMQRLKQEIGVLARDENDVLTYAMFPDIGRDFLQQRSDETLVPEELIPYKDGQATACMAASEFNVSMHGEIYHIKLNGTGMSHQTLRPYYISVDGVPEEILVQNLDSILPTNQQAVAVQHNGKSSQRPRASQPGHVTSAMPATVIEVLVSVGDEVIAGDAVLVIEAMKMETEIQAPVAGIIHSIHVSKGETVTPDEALIEIE
ncbi:MAG TPA: pyruvate carboxylase subunit B, partial [Gammaproteobacteria bacterium]|nr:pyruvate carboxylase subunit B [Gammaproteobacteria bacterium]